MKAVELHTREVDIVLCTWTCTVRGRKSRAVEEEGTDRSQRTWYVMPL